MHSHDRTLLAKLGFADPDKKDRRHDLACQYLALPENAERLARLALGWSDLEAVLPRATYPFHREVCRWRCLESATRIKVTPKLEVPLSKGDGQYKTTIGFLDVAVGASLWRTERGEFEEDAQETTQMAFAEWMRRRPEGWHSTHFQDGRWCRVEESNEFASACNRSMTWDAAAEVYRCPHGHELRPSPESRPASRKVKVWRPGTIPEEQVTRRDVGVEVKANPVGVGDILRQVALYREHAPTFAAWCIATTYAPSALDVQTMRDANIVHVRLGPKFDEWAKAQMQAPTVSADSEEF